MEAPRVYCSLIGPRPPEDRVFSKDVVKLKSFLPKVLFRDNIGLQANLVKECKHLKLEEKRTMNALNHRQKVFRSRQSKKEAQAEVMRYISLQKSINTIEHCIPAFQPIRSNAHYRGLPFGNSKAKFSRCRPHHLPPLKDPRFLKLEKTLTFPYRIQQ